MISREATTFSIANGCGILLYAFLFLRIVHRIAQEQREGAEFADGLAYLTTAFPVLAAFVAFNILWVIASFWHHRRDKDFGEFIVIGVLAIIAWSAAVVGLRYAN